MAIDWQQVLSEFVVTVGGGAVCIAAAAWLVRSVITDRLRRSSDIEIERAKSALSRGLREHEMQLKADSDIQIERLKSALQVTAAEHQIRFSRLHEKRAEVIAEIYRLLVQAERNGLHYVYQMGSVPPGEEGECPPAMKSLIEFDEFLNLHLIYLPTNICNLLGKFSAQLREPAVHAQVYGGINYPNPEELTERNEGFKKAFAAFRDVIPETRKTLEEEFRKLLSVSQRG